MADQYAWFERPVTQEELGTLRAALGQPYEGLTDTELAQALAAATRGMSPEEVENFLNALASINWGNVLSGAATGAATGATIGSVVPGKGTLIGGGIGALVGGLGAALGGSPPPPPRATPSPAGPTPAPTTSVGTTAPPPPAGQLPPPPPAAGASLAAGAADAIGALLMLLQNPQIVQSLTTSLAGIAGKPQLYARESLDDSETSPHRLPEEASERIVRKLNNDLGALARFRQGVTDTTVFPHSAICQLRMQMSRGGGGWFIGTGFYIAPDLILTAAHNILHERYGRATRMDVRPGRKGATEPFGSFSVPTSAMFLDPAWAAGAMIADHDIGLLRVGNPAPNGHYFAVEELRFNPASGIVVCGYAADTTVGLDPNEQHLDYDTIRSLNNGSFTYSLHTTGGTSGSPVFYVDGRRIVAVGIHSRGFSETENKGCRLTEEKIGWIRRAAAGQVQPAAAAATESLPWLSSPSAFTGGLAYLESIGAFGWQRPTSNRANGHAETAGLSRTA